MYLMLEQICLVIKQKRVPTSNEKNLTKNRFIRTATKRTGQGFDLKPNALTSLINFLQLHNKVNPGCKCIGF